MELNLSQVVEQKDLVKMHQAIGALNHNVYALATMARVGANKLDEAINNACREDEVAKGFVTLVAAATEVARMLENAASQLIENKTPATDGESKKPVLTAVP